MHESRVGLFVPLHHLVDVLVILFEASKLLLYQDTTTVVEMVCRQLLDGFHSLPSLLASRFDGISLLEVHEAKNAENERKEERAVFEEVHVPIDVHRV